MWRWNKRNKTQEKNPGTLWVFFTVILAGVFAFILSPWNFFFISLIRNYAILHRVGSLLTYIVYVHFLSWQASLPKITQGEASSNQLEQEEKSILMIYHANFCSMPFFFREQWRQIARTSI